ncbi:hypothetical protein KCG43_20355 [Photobacterium sp. WH24]|uniref:hypothetical protein n=1 Tax=Photobacterium sp. WH24 TaxID=2827237 RepID=UPI001C437D75|nr:hypothetical protein [Photobacterium sp. WH24]MBV7264367.1 hypothetical protein [Photobacterium sp. WH24]
MATDTSMNHNGITVETSEPLSPMGGISEQLGAMIGTAPNKAAEVAYHEPIKLYGTKDLAKLDTTPDPQGTLYHNARFFLEEAKVPLYVIVVPEGATPTDTMQNIVGDIVPATGQRTGLMAFAGCPEAPTNIGVPGFSDSSIVNQLATICDELLAEGWTDGPDTNTAAAKTYAAEFGEAHKKVWCVDVHGERWEHVIAPSTYGMAARCTVKPWNTPNGAPLKLDDLARVVTYRSNDSQSEGVDLNKKGVSLAVGDPDGGIMFLGTRTLDGSFGNIIGVENQIIREVVKSHRKTMKFNLDLDFFEMRIAQLSNWFATLRVDGAVINGKVYLHPERNTVERYNNGEWVLVIDWGAYRPNENSIVELNQVNGIVQTFVESAIQGA